MDLKHRNTYGKVRLSILSNTQRLNKLNEAPIYVVYSLRTKRFRYFTGKYVKPRFWDSKNQRVKPQIEGSVDTNLFLQKVKKQIDSIVEAAITQIPKINPTVDYIKNELAKQDQIVTGKTFLEYFNDWITLSATKDSPETIKGYKSTFKRVVEFSEQTKFILSFESLNGDFYDKFTSFFRVKHTKKGVNYSENTIGKWIKIIKRFLNWASKNGYNQYHSYKEFKVSDTKSDFEYITQDEYNKILNLDLSSFEGYNKVRDLFIFGCNTGLRFGDLMNLKWENIIDNEIRIIPLKTGKKDARLLQIPVLPDAQHILKKYSSEKRPLPSISNQKANLYIKSICQMAGIDTTCNVVKYVGNRRIETSVPKYDRIGMHTVRRTFIIHCLESGMERETVMSITGHKNDTTFKRYVHISSQQRNKELKKLVDMRNIKTINNS